jgi:hypothetical protein
MNTTLWSTTPFNGDQLPARRPTTSHGVAQAALGYRRGLRHRLNGAPARRIQWIVVAALVAAMFVGLAPRGHADTSLASQSLALVNQTRAANGLHALSENAALDKIAQQHAAEMVSKNEIFHYYDIGNRVDAAGVHWNYVGENVGVGPTVSDVHQAFMQSPEHKQNILYGNYNLIGVGVAVASDGSVFVAHEFAGVTSSAPAAAPAPAVHHTSSVPVVHTVSYQAPKTSTPIVKVAPKVVTPAPANHTTSSDPNALLGNLPN